MGKDKTESDNKTNIRKRCYMITAGP